MKIQQQLIKYNQLSKQNAMLYNDRVNQYFRIKEQKQHYRRIVQAKKVIDFSKMEHTALTCVKANHKHQHKQDRERQENNVKLCNRLMDIKNKDGLLQTVEKQARRKLKVKSKSSAQTIYASEFSFAEQQIQKQNEKFVERLSEVRPAVGTCWRWENDFKKSRSFEKRIHKYTKNQSIDPDAYIRQTLTRLGNRKKSAYKSRKVHTSLANCGTQTQNQEQQTLSLRKQTDAQQKQPSVKIIQKKKRRTLKPKNQKDQSERLPISKIILNGQKDQEQTRSSEQLKENKQSR